MNIPTNLKYSEDNEWLLIEGNIATIGITDYAQDQLSDVVYVEILFAEGDSVNKGDTCATVESVKAAADVYIPVSGTVTAVNDVLVDAPEIVNSDPYGEAWLVKIELSDQTELDPLMDNAGYEQFIQEQEG
jgi:glycine cleavage system H protein